MQSGRELEGGALSVLEEQRASGPAWLCSLPALNLLCEWRPLVSDRATGLLFPVSGEALGAPGQAVSCP